MKRNDKAEMAQKVLDLLKAQSIPVADQGKILSTAYHIVLKENQANKKK
jgi:hypothetical protein